MQICVGVGNKTHVRLKFRYPVRNPEVGFFSGSWDCIVSGVQEQSWSDALPDTINDLDGIQTHDQLTMSRKRYPMSHLLHPGACLLFDLACKPTWSMVISLCASY